MNIRQAIQFPNLLTVKDPDTRRYLELLLKTIDDRDREISAWVNNKSDFNRNRIINGLFPLWQRGTAKTGCTTGLHRTADRFVFACNSDTGVFTLADPGGNPSISEAGVETRALMVQATTGDSSIGAAEYAYIYYPVEGHDILDLPGQLCTIQFWVYATVPGIYSFSIRNGATDISYVTEYIINNSQLWERKVITFPMHHMTSGTWNFTTGAGLYFGWPIAFGSNYQTSTLNAWQSGNKIASSNQVNGIASTNNLFVLAAVDFKPSPIATPYIVRPFAQELALAQRYYEKSYYLTTDPGTAVENGRILYFHVNASHYINHPFKVSKRVPPTVEVYSPPTGTANRVRNYTAVADVTPTAVYGWENSIEVYATFAAGGQLGGFQYIANAEI